MASAHGASFPIEDERESGSLVDLPTGGDAADERTAADPPPDLTILTWTVETPPASLEERRGA